LNDKSEDTTNRIKNSPNNGWRRSHTDEVPKEDIIGYCEKGNKKFGLKWTEMCETGKIRLTTS